MYQISTISAASPLGKTRRFADGALQSAVCVMPSFGVVHTQRVTLSQLAGALNSGALRGKVLSYSTPEQEGEMKLVTANALAEYPGAICRTKEHFQFRKVPGLMMLDFDNKANEQECRAAFEECTRLMPMLSVAPRLEIASASSLLYAPDGAQLRGFEGFRVLVGCADASEIPAIFEILLARLEPSAYVTNGVTVKSVRVRYTVDHSTLLNRCDFVGGSVLMDGVEQKRPDATVVNEGGIHLTLALAAAGTQLHSIEVARAQRLANEERVKAASGLRSEVAAFNGRAVEAEVETICKRRGITNRAQRDIIRKKIEARRKERVLLPGDVVYGADGTPIPVADILRNPPENGTRFRDIEEPGYHGGEACAVYFDGKFITYAHGSEDTWQLAWSMRRSEKRERVTWSKDTTDRANENVAAAVAASYEDFELYIRDERLVLGELKIPEASIAEMIVPSCVELVSVVPSKTEPGAFEDKLMSARDTLRGGTLLAYLTKMLPKVEADTDLPVWFNGEWHTRDGVYGSTRLAACRARLPMDVKESHAREAMARIAARFDGWRFTDEVSKSAAVSIPFTALLGASVPQRPAYMLVSHDSQSGKTTLAKYGNKSVGVDVTLPTWSTNESDLDKGLSLEVTKKAALVFDNVSDGSTIKSGGLAKLITEGRYTGRGSGTGRNVCAALSGALCFTGKNITAAQDLGTRLLRIQLDRLSSFKPESRLLDTADGMLDDVLLVMVWASSQPEAEDSGSRFAEWYHLVAKPIAKLLGADPSEASPDKRLLRGEGVADETTERVEALYDLMGDEWFTVKELMTKIAFDDSDAASAMKDWYAEARTLSKFSREISKLDGQRFGRYTIARGAKSEYGIHFRVQESQS